MTLMSEFSSCIATMICFTGLSWPLNYHFVFYLLAASGLLGAALALFLPSNIEKKRDTEIKNSD